MYVAIYVYIYVILGFRNVYLVIKFKVSLKVVKCHHICRHICDNFSSFKNTLKVIKLGLYICPNVS